MAATTIDGRMQNLVRDFVAKVTAVAREAALATLRAQLAAGAEPPPIAAPSDRSPRAPRRRPSRPRARAKAGAKRPAGDIARLEGRLSQHIAANPGQRVEQINRALDTRTNEVRLPLARLLRAGSIRTRGNRRATQYFPA